MELLRIVAMFLVLVVHADYFSLGSPTTVEIRYNPLPSYIRRFFESCSISCVDIFILISGWFGIKPSFRGFSNFIFQCAYFLFGIFAVMILTQLESFSFKGLASCFLCLGSYWFILAYICLYILSPVLNSICTKENQKVLRMILIAFFIFQSLYGWLTPGAKFFEHGYSTISFIGLYLLARYVKLFMPSYARFSKYQDLMIVFVSIIILSVFEFLRISYQISIIKMTAYTNPLVILISLYTLLAFSKLKFQSNLINWIASSSFAVYLLHANSSICKPYYKATINAIYESFSGLQCLLVILLYLVIVFAAAIILDQPRKWIYNRFIKDYTLKIDDKYRQKA